MLFDYLKRQNISIAELARGASVPYGDLALSIPLYPEGIIYQYVAEKENVLVLVAPHVGSEPEFRKRNIIEGEVDG